MADFNSDFHLPSQGHYLLSHSVGRPLKSLADHLQTHFYQPWQQGNKEPWEMWLAGIEQFTVQLATLFNSEARLFCPQANLSSGLTKFLQSLPQQNKPLRLLMSEVDFPSMGFAARHAREDIELEFIPAKMDLSDIESWQAHLQTDIDYVFVSHVYSNTGEQAPLHAISTIARQKGIKVIADVAQSAGIIELDLQKTPVDVLLGSSVKWLCGGPGAAYLWVNEPLLSICKPKDVGWFSHANPFEFNIHHFAYHTSALRFWGGTPSVHAYVCAAHSIGYFNQVGVKQVRAHNWQLLSKLHRALAQYIVSPLEQEQASGTAILSFGDADERVYQALQAHSIALDKRAKGFRVSPHLYNCEEDIDRLISVIKQAL
ncbi:Cysteine desulfurase [Pseudoalteromonas luteoviolacea B = ATCC 29581]|nr:Cysteine desulfurase [Pseudoalteromonas luteoviolacea B = ATCC 29581]